MAEAGAMIALAGIVAPVFLIILLGYGLGRSGLVSPAQAGLFGRFVLLVPLPALIFKALSGAQFGAVFRLDYLVVYGLASLCSFALGLAWFRRAKGDAVPGRAAVRAIGMASSNSAFVGLPVLTQVFGAAAAGPVALNLLVETLIMMPLMLVLVELGQGRHAHPLRAVTGVARTMARSALIWAIVLGAGFALAGLRLPAPLERTVGILAGASAPLALVTIGASLAGVSLHGRWGTIGAMTFAKLVLHPLLLVGIVLVLPIDDPLYRTSAILLAAMPMLSIFPVFAQRTDDVETCSAALLVATAVSFFTLIVVMALLGLHLSPAD